jgi:16S rRNA processing protein RimM
MLLQDELFLIGQINKTHGKYGELQFTLTNGVSCNQDIQYFVIERDGILVPFYPESLNFRGNDSGYLTLEGIDSEEKARSFAGQKIFVPKAVMEIPETLPQSPDYFIGFTVIDETSGKSAQITDINTATANALLIVQMDGDEKLIPLNEDLITDIRHDKQIICMKLPEGLLDL